MLTVGIKELKGKLSGYVKKVREGEEIVVTERGKEIALLLPLSSEHHAVRSLRDEGKLVWAGGKPEGVKGIKAKGKPVSKTILESRR